MIRFPFVVILLLLGPVAVGRAADGLAGRRPNIVFLLTDDQGYGDLSCHGNPILKTPNIDRIHTEGVRFTDFHVSPTCAPTRSALFTGRHEFKNGVTHTILERERLTPKATTLAQVLKSAGYTTGIFGKWHLGDEPDYWPNKRGFDEMFIHGAGGIGQSYPGSCGDAPGNTYFDPAILHNGKFEKTRGYCTDVFYSQATKWIESVKGKQPFFCYVPTNAPHAPLHLRPEDEARYADKVNQPNVAKFFGMIANIDDNVGRLLARLKEWGLEKDTLVIFMNDNGGTAGVKVFNAGMRGQKVTPWLGGTRASSLWRWPGTLQPADCDRLTAHIDFLPTLAEIAGAKLTEDVTAQVEGRSLVPLLTSPKAAWEDRILFTHVGRWPKGAKVDDHKYAHCSVRNTRWHLVCDTAGKKQWQLFDVKADPGEMTDVAAKQPEVVKDLDTVYDKWWTSLPPLLVNEDAVGPKVNPFKELYDKQFGAEVPKKAPTPARKPNVVFLFADDQRADTIAALGNPVIKTPNLDNLVQTGFVFRNAYCMGSTMPAVCNPSRHMLLSGMSLYHYDPKKKDGTFADVMNRAGYVTWHLGKRGNTAQEYHKAFQHSAYLEDQKERTSGHHGRTAANNAIAFMKEDWDRKQPLFTYLAFEGPHDPRVAAEQWMKLYERDKIPLPKNFKPFHPFDNGELFVRDEKLAPWPRTEDVVRQHLHDYYACISSIDHNVGRIVATLKELGEYDNTVVIYSADHGLAMGSHGLFGKQSVYEHSMKSPLIFSGPGIPKGSSDAPAYLFDIFPTTVDLVGADLTTNLDGRSQADVIRGKREAVRDATFLAYRNVQRAVRKSDWKLIRYPQVNVTQLFNLRDDPDEMKNLADEKAHAAKLRELWTLLEEQQRENGDKVPLTVEKPGPATVDEKFFQAPKR